MIKTQIILIKLNIIYNELSIALNMTFEETKEYVINKVQKLIK